MLHIPFDYCPKLFDGVEFWWISEGVHDLVAFTFNFLCQWPVFMDRSIIHDNIISFKILIKIMISRSSFINLTKCAVVVPFDTELLSAVSSYTWWISQVVKSPKKNFFFIFGIRVTIIQNIASLGTCNKFNKWPKVFIYQTRNPTTRYKALLNHQNIKRSLWTLMTRTEIPNYVNV